MYTYKYILQTCSANDDARFATIAGTTAIFYCTRNLLGFLFKSILYASTHCTPVLMHIHIWRSCREYNTMRKQGS